MAKKEPRAVYMPDDARAAWDGVKRKTRRDNSLIGMAGLACLALLEDHELEQLMKLVHACHAKCLSCNWLRFCRRYGGDTVGDSRFANP